MKALLKGKFIASNAYTIKYHKNQISNVILNIQDLQKKEKSDMK